MSHFIKQPRNNEITVQSDSNSESHWVLFHNNRCAMNDKDDNDNDKDVTTNDTDKRQRWLLLLSIWTCLSLFATMP